MHRRVGIAFRSESVPILTRSSQRRRTGEHGVGIGKQEYLEYELGRTVDLLRGIKKLVDPQNIMASSDAQRFTRLFLTFVLVFRTLASSSPRKRSVDTRCDRDGNREGGGGAIGVALEPWNFGLL